MENQEKIRQRVLRLQQQVNDLGGLAEAAQPPVLGSDLLSLHPLPVVVAPSAVSQIRNGEYAHSVDTWNNPPPGSPTLDVGKECAFWFSNDAPVALQVLDFTDSLTNAVNQTLKWDSHSNYDANYCDWDRDTGEARFQGDKTIDAPFPSNKLVANNRAVEYLGALIARRNSTIIIQSDNRVSAGVWNNDAVAADWIRGTPFALTGEVRGVPGTTTELRYKVFAFTDKGFQYLSTELTIAAAPDTAGFATADVYLTWKAIPGILQYAVYRHDIVAGVYRLLRESLVSNTYADNGSVTKDVVGYPTATDTTPRAYTATSDGDLDNIAIDGAAWSQLFLNIPVPSDYDMAAQTGDQVLRMGMEKALDRAMVDVVSTAASVTVESATGEFTSLDTGRLATLFDADGNVLHGPEALIFNDATHIDFTTAVATSNVDATLYIEEGGDHGLLIDAVHISYVAGAAFAAYPDDLNRLQNGGQNPIAAPNHSSQGGPGGGGPPDPGGGGIGCVALDCPVTLWTGLESLNWQAVNIGDMLFSGNLRPNQVVRKLKARTLDLQLVRVRGSWLFDIELPCSSGHPVLTNTLDVKGHAVHTLKTGELVVSAINGHIKQRQIREILSTGQACDVGTFTLAQQPIYGAGRVRYRTWAHRWLATVMKFFGWREPVVSVLAHNRKPDDSGGPI